MSKTNLLARFNQILEREEEEGRRPVWKNEDVEFDECLAAAPGSFDEDGSLVARDVGCLGDVATLVVRFRDTPALPEMEQHHARRGEELLLSRSLGNGTVSSLDELEALLREKGEGRAAQIRKAVAGSKNRGNQRYLTRVDVVGHTDVNHPDQPLAVGGCVKGSTEVVTHAEFVSFIAECFPSDVGADSRSSHLVQHDVLVVFNSCFALGKAGGSAASKALVRTTQAAGHVAVAMHNCLIYPDEAYDFARRLHVTLPLRGNIRASVEEATHCVPHGILFFEGGERTLFSRPARVTASVLLPSSSAASTEKNSSESQCRCASVLHLPARQQAQLAAQFAAELAVLSGEEESKKELQRAAPERVVVGGTRVLPKAILPRWSAFLARAERHTREHKTAERELLKRLCKRRAAFPVAGLTYVQSHGERFVIDGGQKKPELMPF